MKPRLLWVGDAGCPSGFARATHETLNVLRHAFDVTVLGLNYRGDPHDYSYPIYAAAAEGDGFGVNRIVWMCAKFKPDVIVLQNDGWNIPAYMRALRQKNADGGFTFPEIAAIPVVAIVAVDGKNFQGGWLKDVALAIFWTQFAFDEARAGGYVGPACVIPLGVDLETYRPMPKWDARRRRFPEFIDEHEQHRSEDVFIVGNVNRNQPRKRWDLTIKFFAEWIHAKNIQDVWLYLHVAPTGDMGIHVQQLALYYGVLDRLALMEPQTFYGLDEDDMRETYACFDVAVTTTQGEGFGLTAIEAMACGVPVIAPDWSALGDWAKDAVWLVPCSTTEIGPPYVNVIGGVPDQREFTTALDRLYRDKVARAQNAQAALERVREPRFRWSTIGVAVRDAVLGALGPSRNDEDEVGALTSAAEPDVALAPTGAIL